MEQESELQKDTDIIAAEAALSALRHCLAIAKTETAKIDQLVRDQERYLEKLKNPS